MRLKKDSKGKFVGLSSFLVLFALLCSAVFCPGFTPANAASSQRLKIDFVVRSALHQQRLTIDFFLNFLNSDGTINYDKVAKQLGIDFYINETIQLEMGDTLNVDLGKNSEIQPTVGGTEISNNTSFVVSTTSSTGLDVYIYNNDSTKTSDLVGTNTANKIAATSNTSAKGVSGVGLNKWGYNLTAATSAPSASNLIFTGLKTSQAATTGVHANGGSARTTYYLTYAAKIGFATTADTYKNTVGVHAIPSALQTTAMIDAMDAFKESFDKTVAENKEASENLRKAEEINAAQQAKLEGDTETEETVENKVIE